MKAEEILFNQIKEHTENWMKKCGYNIPYDYEGLRHVVFETYAKQSSPSENHYADLVSRIIQHAKDAPYEPYQEKLLRFIISELEIIQRKLLLLPEPPKQD